MLCFSGEDDGAGTAGSVGCRVSDALMPGQYSTTLPSMVSMELLSISAEVRRNLEIEDEETL